MLIGLDFMIVTDSNNMCDMRSRYFRVLKETYGQTCALIDGTAMPSDSLRFPDKSRCPVGKGSSFPLVYLIELIIVFACLYTGAS